MKRLGILAIGLGLALASTAAGAFQEQQGGKQAPAVQPQVAPTSEGAAALSSDKAKPETSGTEVRIPGLGKLGVLPKMDFGLELLYGATEPRQLDMQQQDGGPPASDDLTIRGTVKHRF